MDDLLLNIKAKVDIAKKKSKTSLSPNVIADFSTQYDTLLKQGFKKNPPPKVAIPVKRGRPKQSFARNLLGHLFDHKEAVLAFMVDFNVPFDNNQAERDTRSGHDEGQAKNIGLFALSTRRRNLLRCARIYFHCSQKRSTRFTSYL